MRAELRQLHHGFHGAGRVAFETAHPAAERAYGVFGMPDVLGQHIDHDRELLAPTIPKRPAQVEPEHFKISQQGIEGWGQAIGPHLVDLIGQGGRGAGHGDGNSV